MNVRIPEKNKRSGVFYAVTDDGIELPVIDITHPAFALALDDAQLAPMIDAFVADTRKRERIPKWIERLMLRIFLRGSVLARGLQDAEGGFLAGVHTYLFKLGPENLGAWARPIDRTIAAALPSVSIRLRLQDVVRLLAEGLAPALEEGSPRPLHLVNIGGGPCIDSLDALVMLRREPPKLLESRPIRIHALDLEAAGPSFGARCLAALQGAGAPLQGLDVTLAHTPYDWTRAEALGDALAGLGDGIVAVSSEGALFEYASDADVAANLERLHAHTPRGTLVVGSATSDSELSTMLQRTSHVPLRPRSVEQLRRLCEGAGWRIERLIDRPMCRDVRLVKS